MTTYAIPSATAGELAAHYGDPFPAFDAACKRAPSLYKHGRAADARHALDVAAVAVCREVADSTCDLVQVGPIAVPEPREWTA